MQYKKKIQVWQEHAVCFHVTNANFNFLLNLTKNLDTGVNILQMN